MPSIGPPDRKLDAGASRPAAVLCFGGIWAQEEGSSVPGAQIGRARRLILGVVALEPASSKPGRACELARASIFRVSEAEVEGLRNLFSAQPRCTIARWSTRRRQLSLGAFFVARLRADRSDGLGWAECASEHTARGSVSTPRIWQHPYPGHSWCLVDSR